MDAARGGDKKIPRPIWDGERCSPLYHPLVQGSIKPVAVNGAHPDTLTLVQRSAQEWSVLCCAAGSHHPPALCARFARTCLHRRSPAYCGIGNILAFLYAIVKCVLLIHSLASVYPYPPHVNRGIVQGRVAYKEHAGGMFLAKRERQRVVHALPRKHLYPLLFLRKA